MSVDKHQIKLWSVPEVEAMLTAREISHNVRRGYSGKREENGVPIFVLEGLKKE